jgi:acetate kinase
VRVLVVNAGSSTLKLSVLQDDQLVAARDLETSGPELDVTRIGGEVAALGAVDAVGHRIVHGGEQFRRAVLVDPDVVRALTELSALAPLHQARSLAALSAVTGALGAVPAVACFDTAFHATLPPSSYTYPLPPDWRKRWGLRKYGFHGLAHAYAARRAAELLDRPIGDLRLVTCHLGAGASLAAVLRGHSVDTTMGFTPLDGLMMATRSGSLDPGMILWLLEHTELTESDLSCALEHESGLRALAGSSDMRTVLHNLADGDEPATLAIDVYTHRLRAGIAEMTAAMGGLDALIFSGGVGENAPPVRARTAVGLRFLGVAIDDAANEAIAADCDISLPGAGVATLVIKAREDLEIARQVRVLLASNSALAEAGERV